MLPPGLTIAEALDARTITVSPGPPPARPGRALLSVLAGLGVMVACFWLLLRDPLSTAGSLSMLFGFLVSGGLFVRALKSLQPRDPTTREIRLTATHLVLPEQTPVLLEALTTVTAERDTLRIGWDGGQHRIERLPTETARWLSDHIQQAAIRRRLVPAQPIPAALQAMRDKP